MSDVRVAAMRLVCAKHIVAEVTKQGSFFWVLIHGRKDLAGRVINTVARVVEEWTPPQLDRLTDALMSGWIDQLKFKALVALYVEFGAKNVQEASVAA